MIRGCSKDSTRPRPAALTTTLDKFNVYRDPWSSRRVRLALRSASSLMPIWRDRDVNFLIAVVGDAHRRLPGGVLL